MQNTTPYIPKQDDALSVSSLYEYGDELITRPNAPEYQYQAGNFLEPDMPEGKKKGHPMLRSIGLVAGLVGLFCVSALAGMMSEGKNPYLALFENAPAQQQGEVKGESVVVSPPQYSGLSVGRASEVGQADPTNDNYGTLTPNSPFYQYVETLGGDQITIARQPLPDEFNGSPENLRNMAARIGANQPFATEKWGTAYMMTSGDVQIVAIANSRHMVFLRSMQLHSKDEWKKYIDTFTLR